MLGCPADINIAGPRFRPGGPSFPLSTAGTDLAGDGARRYNGPQPTPDPAPRGKFAMPTPNELYDQALELRDRGDKPGAIARLEEAVAANPAFAIGHGMLAKLYADIAEADKAIEHARRVVELEPDDTFSYTALSVTYQRCGRIPEAEHAKAMAWQKQMGFE